MCVYVNVDRRYIWYIWLFQINPWLTSLGYSLCYGTIVMKMFRVWIIFNKPLRLKNVCTTSYALISKQSILLSLLFIFQQHWLQDYYVVPSVLFLVIIDVVILGVYTIIEGFNDKLGVKLTTNRENPTESIGVRICWLVLELCKVNFYFSLQLCSTITFSMCVNLMGKWLFMDSCMGTKAFSMSLL